MKKTLKDGEISNVWSKEEGNNTRRKTSPNFYNHKDYKTPCIQICDIYLVKKHLVKSNKGTSKFWIQKVELKHGRNEENWLEWSFWYLNAFDWSNAFVLNWWKKRYIKILFASFTILWM